MLIIMTCSITPHYQYYSDYDSEPELDLDLQMEEYLKFASDGFNSDKQRNNIGTAFPTNNAHKTIKKGRKVLQKIVKFKTMILLFYLNRKD